MLTAIEHYINMPFAEDGRRMMEKYGWWKSALSRQFVTND